MKNNIQQTMQTKSGSKQMPHESVWKCDLKNKIKYIFTTHTAMKIFR